MSPRRSRWLAALLGVLALLTVVVIALNLRDESPLHEPAAASATAQQIERGAYLARAGNCATCHTARGGAAYAGGRAINTPFGRVYAGNLTPDQATGIGSWSPADFWRALHNGRSKSGRLLYPAFPYPSYTLVSREDADAIFAYLRTVKPVSAPNAEHALRFPYSTQAALAVWRALFFSPGGRQAPSGQSDDWNRGAYLVNGLGHCVACHAPRNAFGATTTAPDLSGGLIPMQNWYAPSLTSADEAGVADWPTEQVMALLRTGVSSRGSVMGPMADVVFGSTQYLSEADLRAIAVYLKSLPQQRYAVPEEPPPAPRTDQGRRIYDHHCAACHGDRGQGAPGAYRPLAGNRALTMNDPTNLVRIVVNGGFPPTTAGNPQPYGMPPFGPLLNDQEIAALLSYLRSAWGHAAPPVSQLEVLQAR